MLNIGNCSDHVTLALQNALCGLEEVLAKRVLFVRSRYINIYKSGGDLSKTVPDL